MLNAGLLVEECEYLESRGEQVCHLNAVYDLATLPVHECPDRRTDPPSNAGARIRALAALIVDVYSIGVGNGAVAWQRATDRVLEQQATPVLPRWLPAGTDHAAALAAMRAGHPFQIAAGSCSEQLLLLLDGSLYWLGGQPGRPGVGVGGKELVWNAEDPRNVGHGCIHVPGPR